MRHWSQLATRNWLARRTRTLGALLAISLGVGAVAWVSCCYESVRRTVMEFASGYVGNSHIAIQSRMGKYNPISVAVLRKLEPYVAGMESDKPEPPDAEASRPDARLRARKPIELINGRLVQRLRARPVSIDELGPDPAAYRERWLNTTPQLDFHGINPETEYAVRDYELVEGRLLTPEDGLAAVLEAGYAEALGVGPGDRVLVWGSARTDDHPFQLEIVGLFDRRRIAKFQKPQALVPLSVLQRINLKFGQLTSIDVVLRNPTRETVQQVGRALRRTVRTVAPQAVVQDVEARMQQIEKAQKQQEFVLLLLSSVAMLTALFIILSTLSMGMVERIQQLGLMRCVGVTRLQMGWLVILEVLPLGAFGVVFGIPIGLGLTALSVWLVPEYVGGFTVNFQGLLLASIAGIATTLLAAVLPAVAAARVAPLEAAHPRARGTRRVVVMMVLLLALALLAVQHLFLVENLVRDTRFLGYAAAAVVVLYLGYALLAPAIVVVVGTPVVLIVSMLVGLRRRLLHDQVGSAVWRSAGICCGLMVGLSLIVGLVVFNESFRKGWQFPKQFPAAYVWSFEQLRSDAGAVVRDIPGVGAATVCNAENVIVEERPIFLEKVLRSVTWFMGCDPDTFFDLVQLEFLEGDRDEAIAKLKRGGYVLIAEDFARARGKSVGDNVKVLFLNRWWEFEVAAVISSPALDIAAGYFQAQTEANVVAAGSVLGTRKDMEERFGLEGVKLIMFNFDLPAEPPPPGWPPAPELEGDRRPLAEPFYDERLTLERRWQRYREQEVLREIRNELNADQAFTGTVAELKDEIDAQLTRLTQLLAAVPTVALIIAAIGVANLMTANVTSRARQLAILRAIGATRGQILRMVIGEALVLGFTGSLLGLALGMHLALNTSVMVERMWGFRLAFQMPWTYITIAVVLTIGLCVVAGASPARRASRTNVTEALHVS